MRHPFRTLLYDLLIAPVVELWWKMKSLVTPRNYSETGSGPEARRATSGARRMVSTAKASPDKKPAKTAAKRPAA